MGGRSRFRERHRRVRHSTRWAGTGEAAGETAGELLRAASGPRDVIPRHAGAARCRDAIRRPDGQGGREAYLRRRIDQRRRTALESGDAMNRRLGRPKRRLKMKFIVSSIVKTGSSSLTSAVTYPTNRATG